MKDKTTNVPSDSGTKRNQVDQQSIVKLRFLDIFKIALLILSILGAIIVLNDFIDNKIDDKINDSEYISKLSHTLRPYLIINQNSNIVYDHGALSQIDSISVIVNLDNLHPDNPIIITIYPKSFLEIKPLIECLSPVDYVEESKRFKNISWEYKLYVSGYTGPLDEILFRIEIMN